MEQQTFNDTFKILILAIFIGLGLGSAHAQFVPVTSLPVPTDTINPLVHVGGNQAKAGNLSIDVIEANSALFNQDFYAYGTSTFNGVVDIRKDLGVTGNAVIDSSGGVSFETGALTIEKGGPQAVAISDLLKVGTKGTTPGEITINDLSVGHTPPANTSEPWEDRLCLQRIPFGTVYLGKFVMCPSAF